MMTFKFEFALNGIIVAQGTASAVMTYEFQKLFYDSIGPIDDRQGKLSTLESLLNRKVGEHDRWRAMGADGKQFGAFIERIN